MANRFQALDVAIEFVAAVRPIIEVIARRDRDLTSQIKRAASSLPLCLAEGAQRIGKDRLHFYRIAAGSAAEVRTALFVAIAWGYIENVDAESALHLLDRVIAMLWRLTH